MLAIGLVFATMLTVAVAAHTSAGLARGPAFVLGRCWDLLIRSPPPRSCRGLGAPERIATILDGEALVNDGTGLTVDKIAVTAAAGGSFSVVDGGARFLVNAAGGAASGVLAGWTTTGARRRIDEPSIETSISLMTAFLAYLRADRASTSGILAAVAAGLCVGQRSDTVLSAATCLYTKFNSPGETF